MIVAGSLMLATLNRHIGMSDQAQLSREAHTVLPLVSLSLLPLAIATWVIYREIRSTPGRSTRSGLLTSLGIVGGLALVTGLAHVVMPGRMPSAPTWQGWGLHIEEPVGPPSAEPVSGEERDRQICRQWNEIARWLDGEPAPETRDDLSGIPPESWAVPGEGSPTWLYLPRGDSFVLIEPYVIDGERLATSRGESARGVLDSELAALERLKGKGL